MQYYQQWKNKKMNTNLLFDLLLIKQQKMVYITREFDAEQSLYGMHLQKSSTDRSMDCSKPLTAKTK